MTIYFDSATKTQLIAVCLYEDCPLDFKYEALRELQLRWTNQLLPELIKLYGTGMNLSSIADELGVDPYTVRNKLKQFKVYKRRVGA
jgi:hypothetical protein